MTPGGFIPDASLKVTVTPEKEGSNDVKTPLLSRKECATFEVSTYSPTSSPSALAPPQA
jgi:hypothetical protein